MNGIKANAQKRIDQDVNWVVMKPEVKVSGQPHFEMLSTTDRRYKHNKANDRVILKSSLLFRKGYGEPGSVKHYQIFIQKQLIAEVLPNLHGAFGRFLGFTKTLIAYREKYFYLNMAHLIKKWVLSCEQCIRQSQFENILTRPRPQIPIQHITGREDAMQIYLVRELPQSGGYQNIVTAIKVFSRKFFVDSNTNQGAKTVARVILIITIKHA